MSDVILSPNMSLPVPIVGQDPGPDWANNINASLGILDQHSHVTGQGVPITPAALNINSDLTFQGNNLTNLKAIIFSAQLSEIPAVSPYLGALYVAGNELCYNDEVGNQVQITLNGSVNSGAGSITGLPSGTASASYSSGSGTFVWQSATNTPASMDSANIIIREKVSSGHGINLSAPNGLAADYQLTLPAALPGATTFLTVNNGGNIGDSTSAYPIDNATLNVAGGLLQVAPQGIQQGNLALRTVSATAPIGGIAVSVSSGAFASAPASTTPVLSVTLVTTGRPVAIFLNPDGTTNDNYVGYSSSTFTLNSVDYGFYRNTSLTTVGATELGFPTIASDSEDMQIPTISLMDFPPAGTWTYFFTVDNVLGTTVAVIHFMTLVAYEI